VGGLVLE